MSIPTLPTLGKILTVRTAESRMGQSWRGGVFVTQMDGPSPNHPSPRIREGKGCVLLFLSAPGSKAQVSPNAMASSG
jgi:hypothetical protein